MFIIIVEKFKLDDDDHTIKRITETGMDGLLKKPIKPAELKALLAWFGN